MNNKERVKNIMAYKSVDRIPVVHFGYWQELIEEWIELGIIPPSLKDAHIDNSPSALVLDEMLGWDFDWATIYGSSNFLRPYFEYKELEKKEDGTVIYQSPIGVIEAKKAGASGIPGEIDYLLKDRKAYEELFLPRLQFAKDRINREHFAELKTKIEASPNPSGIDLGSVFGRIRDVMSLTGLSYMICDDYELLEQIVNDVADLQYKCVEEIFKLGIKFDFAHYWEDICFKNGPLISPSMFRELCYGHYVKRNKLVRDNGIDIISLDCDGVIDKLLPVWFESGVNTMFPIEIGTWGDQFEPARQKFGKGLFGVGAFDKTVFRRDQAAVDAELKRIARLVKLGGFIPCPDHRLMPGTKWELVKYYTERIKNIY